MVSTVPVEWKHWKCKILGVYEGAAKRTAGGIEVDDDKILATSNSPVAIGVMVTHVQPQRGEEGGGRLSHPHNGKGKLCGLEALEVRGAHRGADVHAATVAAKEDVDASKPGWPRIQLASTPSAQKSW